MELLNYNISELMITYLDDESKNKLILSNIINIDLKQEMIIKLINESSNLKNIMKNSYLMSRDEFNKHDDNEGIRLCNTCNYIFCINDNISNFCFDCQTYRCNDCLNIIDGPKCRDCGDTLPKCRDCGDTLCSESECQLIRSNDNYKNKNLCSYCIG
jgi:hypothetical protein